MKLGSSRAAVAPESDGLDEWVRSYNEERPHQGPWCFGKTRCKLSLTPSPLRGKK
jgi:hypothetical protein